MIRKKSKFLLSIFLVIIMLFSFSTCFVEAIDPSSVEAIDSNTETPSEGATEAEKAEIYNGDLYLFDTKIVMDKLVDGNVFIIGQEVEITGQVNGSLFVCADKLTFNQCYIKNNIFACANSVYYNGACNDFYVISSNSLEMTYDSYVIRDIKAFSSNITLKSAVGRDADLHFTTIDLGEGEDIPIIYGNLRYTAPAELTIPEEVITETGTVTYTDVKSQNTNISVNDILINSLVCIVTVLVIYILIKAFLPNFAEKLNNGKLSILKLLKYFGIGFVSIIVVTILFILLLLTQVGVKLAFVLLLLFILLCLIATPVFAIVIANKLKAVLKSEKIPIFCLVLCLVSVILYLVTLIPFVGWIFSLLITPTALGMLINISMPHKELTDEEKLAIEEAKKQAKEIKEKIKQEKLEAKAAKKQAKKEKKDDKQL